MKKLILLLLLLIPIGLGAQSMWKPVPNDLFKGDVTVDRTFRGNTIWLPRWTAGVSAEQLNYNKVTKKLEPVTFSKIGIGMSAAHFIEVDGIPYNNWSINGFVFFPTNSTGGLFSFALTVSALQYLQIGFDFEPAKWNSDYFPVSPLLGVKYTF